MPAVHVSSRTRGATAGAASRLDRDTMTVTVNSQERLERLLALLTDLDAQPQIVEQTQVDPA